jgi:hypothetical protein
MSLVLQSSGGGQITIQEPATASNFTQTLPAATGTVALLQTPSFATTIGVGGATPSTSGAGITFPATQSASTNANTLDDYEEGTWTPSIVGVSTYATRVGEYVKIGKYVHVYADISATDPGSLASLDIASLPFTVQSTQTVYPVGNVFSVIGFTSLAAGNALQGTPGNTTARIYGVVNSSGSNFTNITSSELASSFTLEISLSYLASA